MDFESEETDLAEWDMCGATSKQSNHCFGLLVLVVLVVATWFCGCCRGRRRVVMAASSSYIFVNVFQPKSEHGWSQTLF